MDDATEAEYALLLAVARLLFLLGKVKLSRSQRNRMQDIVFELNDVWIKILSHEQ